MNVSDERLSPKAVKWLNRELAKSGLRVCVNCQGHPLPLDAEHFYCYHGYFSHTCKACECARETTRAKARYHADEAVRQHSKETHQAWREANLEKHKASCRAAAARQRQRQKAAQFAAVLGKVQS